MPRISTPISKGAWPIRSCTTLATSWRVISAPTLWPVRPAMWFPGTIHWCWSVTRRLHPTSQAGLRDSIDALERADVGALERADVVEPAFLRGSAGARGFVPDDSA